MEQGEANKELETRNRERGFRGLQAWQKADDLATEIFRLTEREMNPRHRWLGLQLMRAAFSVSANIAEGYGRSSLGDYARFLEMAGGSLNEVENGLHFLKRNGIVPADSLVAAEELRATAGNLLFGLMRSLRSKLDARGSWQRGLTRERPGDYQPNSWDAYEPTDLASRFPVASSQFPDPEEYHG